MTEAPGPGTARSTGSSASTAMPASRSAPAPSGRRSRHGTGAIVCASVRAMAATISLRSSDAASVRLTASTVASGS